jgi:hypothetical protein
MWEIGKTYKTRQRGTAKVVAIEANEAAGFPICCFVTWSDENVGSFETYRLDGRFSDYTRRSGWDLTTKEVQP